MGADQLSAGECDYFRSKYGVATYQLEALNELLLAVPVSGRTVLEVGGSNLPRELVIGRLGASGWHCIDGIPPSHYARTAQKAHYDLEAIKSISEFQPSHLLERYNIFDGRIEGAERVPAATFDVALSIAAFEHILDLPAALRAIGRLLKPGGSLFTNFGPIWSCRVGHHIWIDEELNFNVAGSTPPFVHLLHSREEVLTMLGERFGLDRAERATQMMFDSDGINRLFYDDYEALVRNAGFATVDVSPAWEEEVEPEYQRLLEARHPGRGHFSAYSMRILCQA